MHYLDHAATTPIVPEAKVALLAFLDGDFGNPSSVHAYGRAARRGVEDAREQVAAAIGASPAEITFTAGGTEADNLAVKGVATKLKGNGNHIVTTAFEHHAVLHSVEHLQDSGFKVSVVEVGNDGLVDPGRIRDAVRRDTILVSVMAVNNEIGTVQDMAGIVAAAKDANRSTLVHSDAVQALGNIPVDVHRWGVDLASFSAHKLGGPKGVGALFVRAGVPVATQLHGGGHERGLRSGTLNAAGAAAFGAAAEVAAKEVHAKAERLLRLRTRLLEGVRAAVPDVVVNGDLDARVPGNLNVSFPGGSGETLLLLLDAAGIACSSGSACQSGALDPSHVLLAIGLEPRLADASIRFSLGRASTEEDVSAVLEVLPEIVERARKAA
ncbi:MAG TPA: cysteine desulfurase family protein [Actinomycetota bacterium]|nr:cysteine desulfurase family protein [Actinomycetota bacterium]